MARKKRRLEPVTVTETETKPKSNYKDEFQSTVGGRVEEFSKKLEGQGRKILYGLAAVGVLLILIWLFYIYSNRSNAAAQVALGKAIETSQSQISATAPPAGTIGKTFKTEKERAEAAIAEFQVVVDKHGGDAAEKAKYFIATNRLYVDRPAAIAELEALSKQNSEVGSLSKFALAQAYESDSKLDEAAALYTDLAAKADPVVAKETVNYALAQIYEKQGKKDEAVRVLFELVSSASQVKDLDGKAVPLSSTATSAKEKLEQLDPAKAKELPQVEPDPISPF